jgi:hypothetical protein
MLREETTSNIQSSTSIGSRKSSNKKMTKTKKRILAFARKSRRHWRARLAYLIGNGVMLTLVYTTSNTSLWRKDGTVNGEHLFTQILFILFSWVAYFLVQGSDPGYLSGEVTPDEAVEYSTEAMRADMWDEDFLNEGRDDISIAKTKFKKFQDNGNTASPSKKGGKEEESDDIEQGGIGASSIEMGEEEGESQKLFEDDDEDNEFVSLMPRLDTKHPKYPYRTIYCRQVRRWVATFDHYCGVIETPIGEKNHARFWFFLQMQTICLCWAVGIVHSGFRYPYLSTQSWWGLNGHAFITVIILYILLAFVGGLYVFHTWLACTCMTTYEFMRSERIDYLKGTRDFDLPYSRGLGTNLKFFFFKDGLLHIIFNHKWQPQNWKLPGKIVRDSEEWWDNLWENKYWSCC